MLWGASAKLAAFMLVFMAMLGVPAVLDGVRKLREVR